MTRRQEGFTLLEVLVAMGILAVGAASVLSLYGLAVGLHARTLERERATRAARGAGITLEEDLRDGRLVPGIEVPVGDAPGLLERVVEVREDPEGGGEVFFVRFEIFPKGRPERAESFVTAVRGVALSPFPREEEEATERKQPEGESPARGASRKGR